MPASAQKKWIVKAISAEKDIDAIRKFTVAVAKATRFKGRLPDPAENRCGLMVMAHSIAETANLFIQFDGPLQFTVAINLGAIVVNGSVVAPDTERHSEILSATEALLEEVSPSSTHRLPRIHLTLINRFVNAWKRLDRNKEPKSAFEIYRMFNADPEAAELLRTVRMQHTPYTHGQINRFEQLDDYLKSRDEFFSQEQSLIAGNKVWLLNGYTIPQE
ncbi:hypothetical protein [Phyllobacterium sp. SB3]|uniref:hypothetical protein n=1 Tax=Phyllobacterium sp. SB3 TaxID=3156073 RepID=UPI0032AEF48C